MAFSPASPKHNETGKQAQDVFRRLTHMLTGKNDNDSILASSTTGSPEAGAELPVESSNGAPDSSASGTMLERVISSSSSQMRKRNKIADRLKKLGRDIGKFKPTSDKSMPASPRVTVDDIQQQRADLSSGIDDTPGPAPGHAKLLSMVVETEDSEGPETAEASTNAIPPEATSLAKRIEDLIDSLPFPTFNKNPVPKNPKPPARDTDGRPIPPADASPIKDSKLLGFLSSPTIMNGSTIKGKPSIWSILEGLIPPTHGFPGVEGSEGAPSNRQDPNPDVEDGTDQDTIFSDNSSVMIYSPLIPTTEDLVELAELVPVSVQEEPITEGQSPITGTSWTAVWPLSLWYATSSSQNNEPASPRRLSGETVISPRRTSIDSAGRPVRVQTIRAWVPSNSKLSVQAMWWGYRLYLPPPVLAILSDKTLEATKRAAMITTALTWFFNNLPINSLPAAVRPAALLLQRLGPFLGYIGTFISWSWSTIKGYDVGYGVTLTATWLLPIALIPGTWHQDDFPISPTQPPHAPLPPTSPPSSGTSPLPSTPTSHWMSLAPTFSPLSTTPGSPNIQSSPSALSYVSPPQSGYSSPSLSTTSTSVYPRVVVDMPVPAAPEDLAPIPPTPEAVPVPLGSPLMTQLLNGPIIPTVPLPDEDAPTPTPTNPKRKKDGRSRAKGLFTRNSKSK